MAGRKRRAGRAGGGNEKIFIVGGSVSRGLTIPKPDGDLHPVACRRDLKERFTSLTPAVNYLLLCMKKIAPGSSKDVLTLFAWDPHASKAIIEVSSMRDGIGYRWNIERSYVEGVNPTPTRLVDTAEFKRNLEKARAEAAARFGHEDHILDDDVRTIPNTGRTQFEKPYRRGDRNFGLASSTKTGTIPAGTRVEILVDTYDRSFHGCAPWVHSRSGRTRAQTKGKGQYGFVRDSSARGGIQLDYENRNSRPGEVVYLISKSPTGGAAVWFSREALRPTRGERAPGASAGMKHAALTSDLAFFDDPRGPKNLPPASSARLGSAGYIVRERGRWVLTEKGLEAMSKRLRGAARGTAGDASDPLRRLEQEGSFVDESATRRGRAGGSSQYVVTLFDASGVELRKHRVKSATEARALEKKLSADYEGMGAFALTEPNV